MNVRTLAILAATVSASAAFSQNAPTACSVESSTSEIFGRDVEIEGRSAKAMAPMLNELMVLGSKAKDPTKSVGAQLSVHAVPLSTSIGSDKEYPPVQFCCECA
jgi:hypothetical protein